MGLRPLLLPQQVLLMSVLLIGERNLGNYQSPYFAHHQQEVSLARRERRARQEQYRLDLFHQMREKHERTRRQLQADHDFDARHERRASESPLLLPQEDDSKRALSYHHRTPEDSSIESCFQKLKKRQAQLDYQYPSVFANRDKPSYDIPPTPLQKLRKNAFEERLKTENIHDRDKLDSIVVDLQRRRNELSLYDNKKMGEVYQKMHDSIRRISTQNDSTSSPILQLDNRRYVNSSLPKINPEDQTENFSKLPSIWRSTPSRQQRAKESQREWREWYTKEKMRELDSYYRKLTALDTIGLGSSPSRQRQSTAFD